MSRSPRTLVVYFSRTGHSRDLAERIAGALGAEVDAIADHERRSGLLGWLRCGYQGAGKRVVDIDPTAHDPAGYDLVVIGGPVWSASLSSPVRSYLRQYKAALPALGFFYSCGGSSNPKVFAQMAEEAGRAPLATLAVRETERDVPAAIAGFTEKLEQALRDAAGRPAKARS